MVNWIKYLKTNHLIIVAAKMIAETSGSGILVVTWDAAFLYLVIKWTVNVTRVFIG